jgi:hypothetical protein
VPIYNPVSISFRDKANTTSTTELNWLTADAIDWVTDGSGPIDDWGTAVATLSLSTEVGMFGGRREHQAVVLPTDDQAYNSSKLTVFYHDVVTLKPYHYSIPARNPAAYNTYPRTKDVILAAVGSGGTAQIVALVAATQAGLSPVGNAIVVDSIVIAGGKQSGG